MFLFITRKTCQTYDRNIKTWLAAIFSQSDFKCQCNAGRRNLISCFLASSIETSRTYAFHKSDPSSLLSDVVW